VPGLDRLIRLGLHARPSFGRLARALVENFFVRISKSSIISPARKRTEGRAPVWGSEFISKDAALQGWSS
jgi:hypothetical protein